MSKSKVVSNTVIFFVRKRKDKVVLNLEMFHHIWTVYLHRLSVLDNSLVSHSELFHLNPDKVWNSPSLPLAHHLNGSYIAK